MKLAAGPCGEAPAGSFLCNPPQIAERSEASPFDLLRMRGRGRTQCWLDPPSRPPSAALRACDSIRDGIPFPSEGCFARTHASHLRLSSRMARQRQSGTHKRRSWPKVLRRCRSRSFPRRLWVPVLAAACPWAGHRPDPRGQTGMTNLGLGETQTRLRSFEKIHKLSG